MTVSCEQCNSFHNGYLINDPVSIEGELAINLGCKHYSCPIGQIAAINALREYNFHRRMPISIITNTGESIIVVPYDTNEKKATCKLINVM